MLCKRCNFVDNGFEYLERSPHLVASAYNEGCQVGKNEILTKEKHNGLNPVQGRIFIFMQLCLKKNCQFDEIFVVNTKYLVELTSENENAP